MRIVMIAVLLLISPAAAAAAKVSGMGETPEAAMEHATKQSAFMAITNNRCISQMPDAEQCKFVPKLNRWVCYGYVAKEAGSCKDKGADKEWLMGVVQQSMTCGALGVPAATGVAPAPIPPGHGFDLSN